MRKLYYTITSMMLSATLFSSCKEEKSSYSAQIEHLQDTVLHSFAKVSGTTVGVKDSRTLNVVLIGPSLEEMPDADKQQMTGKIADMAQVIFKGTDVDKGAVLFSKTDVNDMDAAMSGKTFDMHLK